MVPYFLLPVNLFFFVFVFVSVGLCVTNWGVLNRNHFLNNLLKLLTFFLSIKYIYFSISFSLPFFFQIFVCKKKGTTFSAVVVHVVVLPKQNKKKHLHCTTKTNLFRHIFCFFLHTAAVCENVLSVFF